MPDQYAWPWSRGRTTLFLLAFFVFLSLRWHYRVPVSFRNNGSFAIRVNSYKRPDMLQNFIEHYTTCPDLEKLIVVWSDITESPPKLSKFDIPVYIHPKVVFEKHNTDRITNRFKILEKFNSAAVLSIDDDLLIPCSNLRAAYHVWRSNQLASVGFAPRMHAFDPIEGNPRYLRWQYTWWNGLYSMMLTKASFIHSKYFSKFMEIVPPKLLNFIDENRNCEDIAMSFIIASESKAPPVWVKGTLYEMSSEGISSAAGHYRDRSYCLTILQETFNTWPWVIASQKAELLSLFDFWHMWWYDTKP